MSDLLFVPPLPLDTATALSPARSVVVKACASNGKGRLLVLPFGLPVQIARTR